VLVGMRASDRAENADVERTIPARDPEDFRVFLFEQFLMSHCDDLAYFSRIAQSRYPSSLAASLAK
jgi:hypothetical protein